MGSRTRFTIASVVSLAAAGAPFAGTAALVACEDGPMYNPAYPIEGGPGVRPTKDVTQPPDPIIVPPEAAAPIDAGTCEPLGAQVDVRVVTEDPNLDPSGGVIPDGMYRLTSAVYADPARDAGVAFKRAAYIKLSGKDMVWSFDTDGEGNPNPQCCIGSYAYNASYIMNLKMVCNGQEQLFAEVYDYHPTGVPDDDAGADAGNVPQIMVHVGELHDIYTKQ